MHDPAEPVAQSSPAGEAPADDHELLRRTAAGEHDAFQRLVERHQARVLKLAYRFLGRWEPAEDVCQSALLRVFENSGRIAPGAQFTTWLYRVVMNLCWDAQRSAARMRRLLERRSPRAQDPEDPVNEDERQRAVRRAVAELPDRQRMVLVLHRFEALGLREICEITGWSMGAVESCLVRAYASLRQKLAHLNAD